MDIIHATWIPEETDAFVQQGAFYLWVETDSATGKERRADPTVHPRNLKATALGAFLVEKLGFKEYAAGALARTLTTRHVLLPSAAGAPLPSFELLRYVAEEVPEAGELAVWQVCCSQVPHPIKTLNDIHFIALHAAEEYLLGADFLFWHRYTQALKGIIARDQYIPALKYQALPPPKGKRTKRGPDFALHPGWELLSASYESMLQQYLAAMPPVCAAGVRGPGDTTLFAKEPLLRHVSECLLHDIVTGTSFTAQFEQRIRDSLLDDCLHPFPSHTLVQRPGQTLEDYNHWLAWRANLLHAHTDAGFTLCFRLEEASSARNAPWYLHFLVAARHDPSLKMDLAEYWALSPAKRAESARRFGGEFEKRLLLALGSAARIYPTIWDGLATTHPTQCRLTLDEAFAFLKEHAWVLEEAGYTVIVPAWWTPEGRRRVKIRLSTALHPSTAKDTSAVTGGLDTETLIAYEYQASIDGQAVSEAEWQQLINAKTPLVQFRGQWMELDREKMQQMLDFWQTQSHAMPEMTLVDLLKLGSEAGDDLEWDHDETLREMLAALNDKSALTPIADPPALQGALRDYQKRGVAWLRYLEQLGLNPCLADDMGLGKTLEVIAHLVMERDAVEASAPTLIIAPTSVIGNWRKEIERFAPHLRVLVHQGGTRHKEAQPFCDACQTSDVVLTSFALARLDEKLLRGQAWARVVIDEAQNIKNPQAAQTRAILRLNAPHRVALTGTPVENRLRDLWSIFNFLNPGYLGKEPQFRKEFELPIAKNNDVAKSAALKQLVEPFILRRVKTDPRIISDLPDKIEQKMYCTLTPEQASLYAAVVKDVSEQLDAAEGIQRKGLILSTILKLKQICNHPAQFLQDGSAYGVERSLKMQRLGEMVEEAIESGESALVFTQFTEIGKALAHYFGQTRYFRTYYLHGGTSATKRDQMVAAFQEPDSEAAVFILSLRAGGVGLNLTNANHVFHFDRWWNPAVEDQATDRAFRIGQRKNVFVHKFIAMGTMEERIDEMIEDKKRLSSLVVGTDEAWLTELDNETFKDLIALRQGAVTE